jgi:hypothetical protein
MKKLFIAAACFVSLQSVKSQTITPAPANDTTIATAKPTHTKKDWTKIDLSSRPNDHFLIQYGAAGWSGGLPDSVKPSGFSRSFNAYVMLDKPFKTNPQYSVALGVGVGSDNIFFQRKMVDLKSQSTRLPFTRLDSANHFKKYKLTTVYAEAPVELRYTLDPENSDKSFKVALGAKVGTLISAHTKGKTLVDKSGNTLNAYISKENAKKFFNSTRLSATARIGYGILSLYGSYQITTFLKDGTGVEIRPYQVGITISGL